MSEELPDLTRLRSGGVAWREAELTPLQEIELLLRELDEIDPDRRASLRRRAAWKVNRMLKLANADDLDGEIRNAVIGAVGERLDRWEVATRREVVKYCRELEAI